MVMEKFEKVVRVNHVRELCDKNKLSRAEFIEEAGYKCKLARPTLEKAYDGETKLEYDTIEKLAWFFEVSPSKVLESRFD